MKSFLRFLAGAFFLIAAIAAINDVTRSLAADRAVLMSTHAHWSQLAPTSLNSLQGLVTRTTHPIVWSYGVRQVLELPAWALLGGIGLALGYLGRRRRRVNIYAN